MMAADALGAAVVCQVGIIVRDIERSARVYADILGLAVPEITVTDAEKFAHEYKGQKTYGRAKLAFLSLGQVQLELIQPVGGPSIWWDFLEERGEGIHHLAFNVPKMEAALAYLGEKGLPLIQRGGFEGGEYAYVDAAAGLGIIIELLARTTADPHHDE